MSIREEIENLIAAEKARLANCRRETEEFIRLKQGQMGPLTTALQEIVDALPGTHVRLENLRSYVRICVMPDPTKHYEPELCFDVEPNYERFGLNPRPGWRVKETSWSKLPEYEVRERVHKLETEAEVCALILPKLVEKVAL